MAKFAVNALFVYERLAAFGCQLPARGGKNELCGINESLAPHNGQWREALFPLVFNGY
jgi:hypothetical protein